LPILRWVPRSERDPALDAGAAGSGGDVETAREALDAEQALAEAGTAAVLAGEDRVELSDAGPFVDRADAELARRSIDRNELELARAGVGHDVAAKLADDRRRPLRRERARAERQRDLPRS